MPQVMKLNDSPGGIPQIGCSTSALGQKQASDWRPLMSALPPKADIVPHGGNVRFVPQADSCTAAIGGKNGAFPYRIHATMEPMNATALFSCGVIISRGDTLTGRFGAGCHETLNDLVET
jgi:hypothetical protein